MPGPFISPPPPPLPTPDLTPSAEQRLSAVRYVCIDEAVPKELHSIIHSFISHHKLSPSPHLCGYSLLIVSHNATEGQLLALHGRIASLVAVTLLPSSLFLSIPAQLSSSPASAPPTRPVLLSFLSMFCQWRVSCSALPVAHKSLLAHLTTALSGHYGKDFDLTYTHLITTSSDSDKYAAFQKFADKCVAVHPSYLLRCYMTATLHAPTAAESQRLLSGLRVCVTGIEAQERNTIMRLIQAEGGEYSANLTKACTHLIAQKAEGPKYVAAVSWGLMVVSKGWLSMCVTQRRVVEEKDWPVGTMSEQGETHGEEERKETVQMEVDGGDSKQEAGNGVKMNGHSRPSDDRDDEVEQKQERARPQQQPRQDDEKRQPDDEHKEQRKRDANSTSHQSGTDTVGWKKKPKKATKEQKAEEDDSLKTVPMPERSQSPRPTSPTAFAASAPNIVAPASSPAVSASPSAVVGGNDSYLDIVQVLLCLPLSSPSYLRCVAMIRAGGGTRLSSYRPAVTHIVALDVAQVHSTLRSDRLSILPSAALIASTPSEFVNALATPIVSPDWLERCHTSKRVTSSSPFELVADDEIAAPPPAPSRPSSVARQKVVNEFSAFNDSIAREKREVTAAASVTQKKRRRTRSNAKGVFAGKLFAFETLELREQEELLLSIRNEGGDVLAADETEDDVHIVVTKHWTDDLSSKYKHAIFVTPAYINDRLTNPSLQQPTATLDHQPLPEHSTPLPSFTTHIFALTGFNRREQEQLKRLLLFLGAKAVTDGMGARNTHLVCKEGCAAGAKWELAWNGGWKGRVVQLQWLVECVRQGKEVPLTDELAWRKEDGSTARPGNRGKAAVNEMQVEETDEHDNNAGMQAVVTGTHGNNTSASTTAVVSMQDEAKQPPPCQPEPDNGREADEVDLDETEKDSTAEHMDIDTHNTTSAQPSKAPTATHDPVEEQTDILAPLPPPSPNSTNSSPFPTRYGRQHGQRTNRIYTPPKTPNSASVSPAEEKGSGERRARRRRLAVEDKAVGEQLEEVEDDPFGFQGADEVMEDKRTEEKRKEKTSAAAGVKEKADVQRKRIQEDVDDEKSSKQKSSNGQTAQTSEVKQAATETETKSKTRAIINGERGAQQQVEEQLEQLEEATEQKEQKEAQTAHNGVGESENDERRAPTAVGRSQLPGRKRLNRVQREEAEEEEEAEYAPAPSEVTEEVGKEATTSSRKRPSRQGAKAVPKQDKLAEELPQQPTTSRKGRASRTKRSVTPQSESANEEGEGEGRAEEVEEKSPTSSTDSRLSTSGRKSARAQRKEQLKAQEAASPVKSRSSRRAAPQHDSETAVKPDANQLIRTTRKRHAAQADDMTSIDSGDSSSSTAKRVKASSPPAATADDDDSNKYRFAISSSRSWSVDKAASLREMIEQLGAVYIDEADDYSLCSAVVVKDETQLKRTEKVLAAIVAGLPILPRSYIEDSSQRGNFLSLSGYRLKFKDAVDDTGKTLMKAAERWQKRRPFDGWVMWIADSRQERMLTNVLTMGGGKTEKRDIAECTDCLVDVEEHGVEAVMRRMWNAGVAVYRSAMVVEFICHSDQRQWNMEEFKVTKDNWDSPWINPWKDAVGSQPTHAVEGGETDGRRKRRS